MKSIAVILVAAMICLTASADAVIGAQTTSRAFVKGAVSRSNKPVVSVWVVVSQGGRERGRSLTGDDGKFYIGRLDDGTYDIVVLKGSGQVFKGQITLPKNATFNIKL